MSEKKKLRIVFMGTPDFAVPSLEILAEHGYEVAGVITAPDKPAGRGRKLKASPVKRYALENGLKVLQPRNLKAESFLEELRALDANLFIVVAFRMLPVVVWSMPKYGTFNLHGSLLPDYRGAAPINWAVINGEGKTGLTTFFLQHEIDTGEILLQEEVDIGQDSTAGEMHDKMMTVGANLVLDTVRGIESNTLSSKPQGPFDPAKKAPKIFTEDTFINWTKAAKDIHNFIRGLSPFPGARFEACGKTFKLLRAKPVEGDLAPGEIDSDEKQFIHIGTGKGAIEVLEIQAPGKKAMKVKDFLNGNGLKLLTDSND